VLVAGDVDAARVQLGHAPELVLLDIHIPGGGGETLLRELRTSDATRDLPVVALTASAMRGDRERFLRDGFTAYMSKPIEVATFGAKIEALVRGTP